MKNNRVRQHLLNIDLSTSPPKVWQWFLLPAILFLFPIQVNKLNSHRYLLTISIIFICILAYIMQLVGGREFVLNWSMMAGEWSELLSLKPFTSTVIHGEGFFHAFANIYFMYTFGRHVENRLGSLIFFIFCLLSMYFVDIVNLFYYAETGIRVSGLSGLVSAIIGFFLVHFWYKRLSTFFCFIWITYPVVYVIPYRILLDFIHLNSGDGVSHISHISGTIYGIIFGLLIKYKMNNPTKPIASAEKSAKIDWV